MELIYLEWQSSFDVILQNFQQKATVEKLADSAQGEGDTLKGDELQEMVPLEDKTHLKELEVKCNWHFLQSMIHSYFEQVFQFVRVWTMEQLNSTFHYQKPWQSWQEVSCEMWIQWMIFNFYESRQRGLR